MRSQFRCNLLRSAQTCSYVRSDAPGAKRPSPPLPLLHRVPATSTRPHPCSSMVTVPSASHFSHKKFAESKPMAPLSTTPPRKNKANQTHSLAFESASGKGGAGFWLARRKDLFVQTALRDAGANESAVFDCAKAPTALLERPTFLSPQCLPVRHAMSTVY